MRPRSRDVMTKAVILAGGSSRRMGGGNKCLKELKGKPILAHVIERLEQQTSHLAVNANDAPSLFLEFGLPVLPDIVPNYAGPLAGVLTAMEWVGRNWSHDNWVMTVPGDVPFIPAILPKRLQDSAGEGFDLVAPTTAADSHFLCGLWRLQQAKALRDALVKTELRAVKDWIAQIRVRKVPIEPGRGDSFMSVNTLADLEAARQFTVEVH